MKTGIRFSITSNDMEHSTFFPSRLPAKQKKNFFPLYLFMKKVFPLFLLLFVFIFCCKEFEKAFDVNIFTIYSHLINRLAADGNRMEIQWIFVRNCVFINLISQTLAPTLFASFPYTHTIKFLCTANFSFLLFTFSLACCSSIQVGSMERKRKDFIGALWEVVPGGTRVGWRQNLFTFNPQPSSTFQKWFIFNGQFSINF